MFYYSKDAHNNVVHTKDCYYIKNISPESLCSFENFSEVQENNFRVCNHCNIIAKAYRAEKNKLYDYCMQKGYAIFLEGDKIIINSNVSCWKIVLSKKGNTMVLYHKNIRGYNDGEIENDIEYHYQKVTKQDILGYLKYISEHDDFRYKNPTYIRIKPDNKMYKGTKKYQKAAKAKKKREKRNKIKRVMNLFKELDNE